MILKSEYKSSSGEMWDLTYTNIDDLESIKSVPIKAVGAICFYKEKMVLVYAKTRSCWEMPGGMIEEGESVEEAMRREIREESNMRVLELFPLGYEVLTSKTNPGIRYQLRFAARVEPIGEFVSDPDGEITEMKLVDPKDYKQYFDWGERIEILVSKALGIMKS